ncbi:Hint domain-containing protein [Celeribacter neptunius]|uniref:Hint domain-containing protein n=1 Tax=Celeribacter neptunius TaxID=588602 RepID=A0A1I3WCM8_9RHOB|nr:Hint domain-containing protein [Celeribacter neptunius]SFK04231.1 Hint domain-containing protein [Celeribacter neptunius]
MAKLAQMFQKEPTRNAMGRSGVWDGALHAGQPVLTSGLTAGTQVATQNGWRDVESLQVGDKVLTFDAGLQPVRRLSRSWTYVDYGTAPRHTWPLCVPAGALGNKTELHLLPEQSVMVESDAGETMFGDPFTLVPAQALDGYKGIAPERPRKPMEVVTLEFDTEQVVFANVGALFHCPAPAELTMASLMEDHPVPGYDVLSLAQARRFIDRLMDEDALDAAWIKQERQSRQPLRYAN